MAKKSQRPTVRRPVVLGRATIILGAIAYAKEHNGLMPKVALICPDAWRRLVSEVAALPGSRRRGRRPIGQGAHAVSVAGVYVYALAGSPSWDGVVFFGPWWPWTPNEQAGEPV